MAKKPEKPEAAEDDSGEVALFEDRFKLIELGDAAVTAYNEMTAKMRAITVAYLETGRAWEAYKKATGYDGPNETAGSMGRRILRDVRCKTIIEAWRKLMLDNLEVTPEKVTAGMARIAFGDVRGFFNPDGTMKDIPSLPRTQADMIAGFEVEELYAGSGKERTQIGIVKKVKLCDRKAALDSLARTQGMFLTEKKKAVEGVKIVKTAQLVNAEEWKKNNAR